MKIETIELRKIKADEGMVLTNGLAYGTEIYLGKNDSEYNWYEITEEEYEDILSSQENNDMVNID